MDSKPARNSQRVTTLPTDQYRSPGRASCQARTDGLDESAIETCLLMVRVGLRNHSPDQAKAAIDRAFEQPPPLTMRSDLVDMGLDPTIAGFLRTAGIESIGDLAGRTE